MASFMRWLNVISRCSNMYRTDQLADTDLGAAHASYILALCYHPDISQEDLAKHLCINRSNVTRSLHYLEKQGYVTRRPSALDRRVTLVSPTEKAFAVLPRIQGVVRSFNAFLLEDFTEEEQVLLTRLVERAASRARQYYGNADAELTQAESAAGQDTNDDKKEAIACDSSSAT